MQSIYKKSKKNSLPSNSNDNGPTCFSNLHSSKSHTSSCTQNQQHLQHNSTTHLTTQKDRTISITNYHTTMHIVGLNRYIHTYLTGAQLGPMNKCHVRSAKRHSKCSSSNKITTLRHSKP